MELNHLRCFYEVAKQGSFTGAARALRTSQPSLSKMVRLLEEREQLRLFERNRAGVALTDSGKIFFERCEVIFNEVERLKNYTQSKQDRVEGELRIGASDNLSNYLLPEIFQEFWKRYPGVRIKVLAGTSEVIKEELKKGKLDLGLFFHPAKEKRLKTEKIGATEFVLICSSLNERLKSGKFDRALLEEFYFIGSRLSDYPNSHLCLNLIRSLGIEPNLFFETNNQETQKRMAMRELGYALLPYFMVERELREGALRKIRAPKRLLAEVYLVKRRDSEQSRATELFESFLRDRLPDRLSPRF